MASMAPPPPGFDDIEWIDEGGNHGGHARKPTKKRPRQPPTAEPDPKRYRNIIPRKLLDPDALDVVRTLQRNGHEAYLVGGCVRDLLVGLAPKDFDVATDAHPNRIKRLFRRARVIGRRFRLVHIRYSPNHVIETATFRGTPEGEPTDRAPQMERDPSKRSDWRQSAENVFGTAYEDAHRRDFTVNALFYDPADDSVIDWVGGYDDIQAKVIRCIGDPHVRIEEDPVRMLRAVHFSERMAFKVEPKLESAIRDMAKSIMDASNARLYVELIKMLSRNAACGTFRGLHTLGVLSPWLPQLDAYLAGDHDEIDDDELPTWVCATHTPWLLLQTADGWDYSAHEAVPDSIRLAGLFGPYLLHSWVQSIRGPKARQSPSRGKYVGRGYASFQHHMDRTFGPVARMMSIPRWATRELCDLLWIAMHMAWEPRTKYDRSLLRRRAFPPALVFTAWCAEATRSDPSMVERWGDEAHESGAHTTMKRYTQSGNGQRTGGGRRGSRSQGRGRGGQNAKRRGGRRSDERRGPSKRPRKSVRRRRYRPAGVEADAHAPPPPRGRADEDSA